MHTKMNVKRAGSPKRSPSGFFGTEPRRALEPVDARKSYEQRMIETDITMKSIVEKEMRLAQVKTASPAEWQTKLRSWHKSHDPATTTFVRRLPPSPTMLLNTDSEAYERMNKEHRAARERGKARVDTGFTYRAELGEDGTVKINRHGCRAKRIKTIEDEESLGFRSIVDYGNRESSSPSAEFQRYTNCFDRTDSFSKGFEGKATNTTKSTKGTFSTSKEELNESLTNGSVHTYDSSKKSYKDRDPGVTFSEGPTSPVGTASRKHKDQFSRRDFESQRSMSMRNLHQEQLTLTRTQSARGHKESSKRNARAEEKSSSSKKPNQTTLLLRRLASKKIPRDEGFVHQEGNRFRSLSSGNSEASDIAVSPYQTSRHFLGYGFGLYHGKA